jgi:predicted helicase
MSRRWASSPAIKKISVIIGNPPYNANQQNENDNNKNRTYPRIDERIKATYIKESTAQKTKAYDMYTRFFRWASDRLRDDGIVAFITNRSFIDSRTMDGFRRCAARDFAEVWIVDLGGDVRANPKLSGTKNNVFGIQTGVAISFLVKKKAAEGCRIFYARRPEMETKEEKLEWLGSVRISTVQKEETIPDSKANWINITNNDFPSFIPIASKQTKNSKIKNQHAAIFKLFSLGVVTSRDEWVYDHSRANLSQKVREFIHLYEEERIRWLKAGQPKNTKDWVSRKLNWTSELEGYLRSSTKLTFNKERIRTANYRPFCALETYFDRIITHRIYQQDSIFPIEGKENNTCVVFTDPGAQKPWFALSVVRLPDLHFVGAAAGTACMPRWSYGKDGARLDNITDWALDQFRTHYSGDASITKDAIFHYVYAVLHDPLYRETYAQNLKREFPRIPFYADFSTWAAWGEKLMALHIGYESVAPWPLARLDAPDAKARAAGQKPKTILKADKEAGILTLDSETQLTGIPEAAWSYRLGNRSALEWILDQHKEKTPKDPTIREKFNTYHFADYKEKVVDLLLRVTRVSVETMEIVEAMRAAPR